MLSARLKAFLYFLCVCFLCAISLFLLSCNPDSAPLSTSQSLDVQDTALPNALTVRHSHFNREFRCAEFAITLSQNSGEEAKRYIALAPRSDGPYPCGATGVIRDAAGNLLFEISVAWDSSRPDHLWLRERTGADELTLYYDRQEGHITEHYILNGSECTIEYPEMEISELKRLSRLCQQSHLVQSTETARLDDKSRVCLGKIREFHAFYSRFSTNTLHHNPDGETLVRFIESEYLQEFLGSHRISKIEPGDMQLMSSGASNTVCAIASLCGVLKCMFGGWVNPLCVACGGTAAACAIAEIFLAFVGE